MILKEADDRSNDIAALESLKGVAASPLHEEINKQIRNLRKGAKGERDAAHFIGREFGSSKAISIIHDLRFEVDGEYAQIDHLVLHRVQATAWVLETKNWEGQHSCNEHGDWTIDDGQVRRDTGSPLSQARRQCAMLRRWLDRNGIQSIHDIHPVVLISPTSSIDRTNLPAGAHVVKSDNFCSWWRHQAEKMSVGKVLGIASRHLLNGMTHDEFILLGQRLVQAHVPSKTDWRAKFGLSEVAPQARFSASSSPRERSRRKEGVQDDAQRRIISTPHGDVTITQVPDGRFAIRNEKNDALIEIVRSACRGNAEWKWRYSNWIVHEDRLEGIITKLTQSSTASRVH